LPVVYLDPGLAEALRDTDLPSDLSISDIGFSWPSVRLMVPRDLCLSSDGRSGQIQYVDVAFCGQDEVINLSEELASDLRHGLAKFGGNRPLDDRLTKGFIHPQAGQFYACALSYRRSGTFQLLTVQLRIKLLPGVSSGRPGFSKKWSRPGTRLTATTGKIL
jgi:hypothetical protein